MFTPRLGELVTDGQGWVQRLRGALRDIGKLIAPQRAALVGSRRRISMSPISAGIGIRFGDLQSKGLVETIGASANSGVLRVPMVHYNTVEEVDRLDHML